MTQSLASGFIYGHLILSMVFALHAHLCSDENAQMKERLKKWGMGCTPSKDFVPWFLLVPFPLFP